MSMDAGGLAQMTYQPQFNNNIGVSGPGFGSRGKANHIKRLSVAPPAKISTIDETQQVNAVSTPRTARGHLLAGLRTAPKSAALPSANSSFGLESSRFAAPQFSDRGPQTSIGSSFPSRQTQFAGNQANYTAQQQVLAPPQLELNGNEHHGMDQNLYDEIVATNNYLAQQQRALQQKLYSIQQATQQLGNMNLNAQMFNATQQMPQQSASGASFYHQQLQQGLQPVVQPVPGSPGVFAVYNPMTGQSSFVVDNSFQQQDNHAPAQSSQSTSPPPASYGYQRRQSPDSLPSQSVGRSQTPPKTDTLAQRDVEPLPPPSANAFRRGHKKNLSSVTVKTGTDWSQARIGPKSAGFPATPMTGTFGPGQGRAGEHPIRQPRGPPLIQELEEKPTSKHEGSKNFATRQRRRAVHDLVRAGRERTESRQSGSGSGSPGSEIEFNLTVSQDNDPPLTRSVSLPGKSGISALAAASSRAIGSDWKGSRDGSPIDGGAPTRSTSNEEGHAFGGSGVDADGSRRRTPMLVLTSAEKRKSVAL